MKSLHQLLLTTIALLLTTSLFAQDVSPEFKAWGLGTLKLRFSRNTSFTITQLSAIDLAPTRFQFLQVPLSMNRRIGERWNLDIGIMPSWFTQEDGVKMFNRVFTEVDFKQRWGRLRMKHSLRTEYHFPQIRKYRMRFIYSNKISYQFRDAPGRLTPFLRQQIFWYQSGRTIDYYEDGEIVETAPSNGFHRYRMTLGVRARLAKRFYGSLFYTWQREFNVPWTERGLNVQRPNGRIQAPFNNYALIGVGLSYTLKLY
ncbi:MAG: DUF2490 domain-containing protein [Bacteroidota bacterium]